MCCCALVLWRFAIQHLLRAVQFCCVTVTVFWARERRCQEKERSTKNLKEKNRKRRRCQVNRMSRERDVQRKSQEREMSRDFKRNRVQEEEIHNKVISEESSASRTRHFQAPCPTSSMLLPNCDLTYAGPQMPTMGRMMMIAPLGLRMVFQPPRDRSKGPKRWRNKPQRCGQSCTRPAS